MARWRAMPKRRLGADRIVTKLRQIEILYGQGKSVSAAYDGPQVAGHLVRKESKIGLEHRTRMRIVSRGQGQMRIVTNAHDDGRTRMTKLARNALRFALAAAAGTVCLFINDNMSTAQRSSLITQADARIGEPLTPGSVAGVAARSAATTMVMAPAAITAHMAATLAPITARMPLTRALTPFTPAAITAPIAAAITVATPTAAT